MTKIVYSRDVAVKEGYRVSKEVDKGFFKRPIMLCTREGLESKYFEDGRKRLLLNLTSVVEGVVQKSFLGGSYFYRGINSNRGHIVEKLKENNKLISIKNAIECDSFKNKMISGYIEKQSNNIYTISPMETDQKGEVYQIKLNKFYNIAGKKVYIILDKYNGIYQVKEIINY